MGVHLRRKQKIRGYSPSRSLSQVFLLAGVLMSNVLAVAASQVDLEMALCIFRVEAGGSTGERGGTGAALAAHGPSCMMPVSKLQSLGDSAVCHFVNCSWLASQQSQVRLSQPLYSRV